MAKSKSKGAGRAAPARPAPRGFYLEREETVRVRVSYWIVAESEEDALAKAAVEGAKYVSREEIDTVDTGDFRIARD